MLLYRCLLRKLGNAHNQYNMKTKLPLKTLTFFGLSLLSCITANAAALATIGTVNNNNTVTAIYGSGNPDGHWVTATTANVSTGVRFKERSQVNFGTTDGLGGTTFTTGTHINVDFTVSSGSYPLSGYTFILSVDNDPTVNQSWVTIDLKSYLDNSFGTSSTTNGSGNEGTWSSLAGSNTVAQNSQRTFWLGIAGNPSPNIGQYDVALTAYSVNDLSTPIAKTFSTLTVVPEPSSGIALGLEQLDF